MTKRQRRRREENNKKKKKLSKGFPNLYKGTTVEALQKEGGISILTADSNGEFISGKAFYTDYIAQRKPVIIRGHPMVNNLQKKWTRQYMEQKAGSAEIEIERRANLAEGFGLTAPKLPATFADFLRLIYDQDDVLHYLTTQKIELDDDGGPNLLCTPPISLLSSDLPVPHPLSPSLVLHQLNLWMGNNKEPLGTSSGLHHDSHDNFYLLLEGQKEFVVFSPADAHLMYTVGRIAKVHRNGVINYEGFGTREDGAAPGAVAEQKIERINKQIAEIEKRLEELPKDGQEDGERAALEQSLATAEGELEDILDSQLDGDEFFDDAEQEDDENAEEAIDFVLPHFSQVGRYQYADPSKFPLLKKASPLVVHLEPGDMLFLPSGWFHDVTSRGRSCAVNYWFYPPSSKDDSDPYPDDFWAFRQQDLLKDLQQNQSISS